MNRFWRIAIPIGLLALAVIFLYPLRGRRLAEEPPKTQPQSQVQQTAAYAGSDKCRPCHAKQVEGWKKHLHSQFIQDAKKKPEAIKADWTKPGAPTVVKKEDVDFTVGGFWKQRYMVKRGNDYFYAPAEWVVKTESWRPYSPKPTDKPAEVWTSEDRSMINICVACKTTGFNPTTRAFTEMSIGCEACHGPGSRHIVSQKGGDIINPAKLEYDRRLDVCGQCHMRGTDKTGKYEDARGFKPGDDLSRFANLLKPEPGKETDAFFADGAAKKHHQQIQEYVQSKHYASKKVDCDTCHAPHSARETLKDNSICGKSGCHPEQNKDLNAHTQKTAGRTDITLCVTCHMPKRAKSATERDIASHTFKPNQIDLKTVTAEPYRN